MFVRRNEQGKIVEALSGFPADWEVEEEMAEDNPEYIAAFTLPITSVSARQFKLQLLAMGLLDDVEAWVAAQPKAVQIAFEYSGTFVMDDPVMQQGFADMGFTDEQVVAFFQAASEL